MNKTSSVLIASEQKEERTWPNIATIQSYTQTHAHLHVQESTGTQSALGYQSYTAPCTHKERRTKRKTYHLWYDVSRKEKKDTHYPLQQTREVPKKSLETKW